MQRRSGTFPLPAAISARHATLTFGVVLAMVMMTSSAWAEGHLVTRLGVRLDEAALVPDLGVTWTDETWGAWTLTARVGFDGDASAGWSATRHVTFGPLGVVLLETAMAARYDVTGVQPWSVAGSLTGRGNIGPIAARLDLKRWTSMGSDWRDEMLGPLPFLENGALLDVQVDARASQAWLVSGSWQTAWSAMDASNVASVTVRQRRALGSERDLGATLRVGRTVERTVLGVQVGVWHVPRRAPDGNVHVGVDVGVDAGGATLAPWVSSDGAWRTDVGLLRWVVRVDPHGLLRPGLDVALRFEPSAESSAHLTPFLDAAWNGSSGDAPARWVRLGVDVAMP